MEALSIVSGSSGKFKNTFKGIDLEDGHIEERVSDSGSGEDEI